MPPGVVNAHPAGEAHDLVLLEIRVLQTVIGPAQETGEEQTGGHPDANRSAHGSKLRGQPGVTGKRVSSGKSSPNRSASTEISALSAMEVAVICPPGCSSVSSSLRKVTCDMQPALLNDQVLHERRVRMS